MKVRDITRRPYKEVPLDDAIRQSVRGADFADGQMERLAEQLENQQAFITKLVVQLIEGGILNTDQVNELLGSGLTTLEL